MPSEPRRQTGSPLPKRPCPVLNARGRNHSRHECRNLPVLPDDDVLVTDETGTACRRQQAPPGLVDRTKLFGGRLCALMAYYYYRNVRNINGLPHCAGSQPASDESWIRRGKEGKRRIGGALARLLFLLLALNLTVASALWAAASYGSVLFCWNAEPGECAPVGPIPESSP